MAPFDPPRRDDAVEEQSGPDEVVPDPLVAQEGGAVRGVTRRRSNPERADLRARALEALALDREHVAVGIVGGREVRVDGVDRDVAAGRDFGIRPREEEDRIVELRAGRPDFLAVDEEVIAHVDGFRLEVRQVRAGVRLREPLGPRFIAA